MLRSVDLELLVHGDHYPAVIDRVLDAQRSVWIATANLKELMIEDRRLVPGRRRGRTQYRSVLAALAELSAQGVELRILHAAPPSRVFRRDFDRLKGLVTGGLEMRLCPRTHLKLVIVDGRHLYFGSANWTGAGLGAKHDHRRNFELGLLTQDERLLDAAQEVYERVWRGGECADCRMRDTCPMPLAAFDLSPLPAVPSSSTPKRTKRARKAAKRTSKRKAASRDKGQAQPRVAPPQPAASKSEPTRSKRARKKRAPARKRSVAKSDS